MLASTPQSAAPRRRRWHRFALGAVVALSAVGLTGCFGPGLYTVGEPLTGTQMPPGLYRSLGGSDCTWKRIDRSSRTVVGTNLRTNGPQYLQVEPSDFGAAVGSCLPFWQHPGAFQKPLAQPGNPFGDGDFLVGYEVMPGTYRATAPPGQPCAWAAVKGFHGVSSSGRNPDQTRGDTTTAGAPTAVIEPGDFGFTSQGCGQWDLVTPFPPAPVGSSASGLLIDGVKENFADPFVLQVKDPTQCDGAPSCYFGYATEGGFLGLVNVPVATSTDLSTWSWPGADVTNAAGTPVARDAMPVLGPWVAFGANWAPSVLFRPANPPAQRYVMYYTAKSQAAGSSGNQCVGIATSASPAGPFVDTSTTPALCNVAQDGTIDPSPYVAGDGSVFLSYADDAGIRSQRLSADGLTLTGGEQLVLHFDNGYSWELPRVEGPSMFSTPQTGIVLLYSAGTFSEPTYSVGAAACDTPLGPCHHLWSTPVLASRGAMLGPGGQTPFQVSDGSWRLAFHAWDGVVGYDAGGTRSLHILPLNLVGNRPTVG